jgi:hypothetical protein
MNRWWSQQPGQRYWLEATDREDIGLWDPNRADGTVLRAVVVRV